MPVVAISIVMAVRVPVTVNATAVVIVVLVAGVVLVVAVANVAVAGMPASIAIFIAVEDVGRSAVLDRPLADSRHRSAIAIAGIVTVIDRAVKLGRAVEPGSDSDEHPAVEVLRSIVSARAAQRGRVRNRNSHRDRKAPCRC